MRNISRSNTVPVGIAPVGTRLPAARNRSPGTVLMQSWRRKRIPGTHKVPGPDYLTAPPMANSAVQGVLLAIREYLKETNVKIQKEYDLLKPGHGAFHAIDLDMASLRKKGAASGTPLSIWIGLTHHPSDKRFKLLVHFVPGESTLADAQTEFISGALPTYDAKPKFLENFVEHLTRGGRLQSWKSALDVGNGGQGDWILVGRGTAVGPYYVGYSAFEMCREFESLLLYPRTPTSYSGQEEKIPLPHSNELYDNCFLPAFEAMREASHPQP